MWVHSSRVMNVCECVFVFLKRSAVAKITACSEFVLIITRRQVALKHRLSFLLHCVTYFLSVSNYLIVPLCSWSWHQFFFCQTLNCLWTPLSTSSFGLYCINTIECTLNGFQVLPRSSYPSNLTVSKEPGRNQWTLSCHSLFYLRSSINGIKRIIRLGTSYIYQLVSLTFT